MPETLESTKASILSTLETESDPEEKEQLEAHLKRVELAERLRTKPNPGPKELDKP